MCIKEQGEYTEKVTLVLTLLDTEPATVDDIASDLCSDFHQESVLITEARIRAYYASTQPE